MRRSAAQHVIASSWQAMQEGEREPDLQKRIFLYAETLLPKGVFDAMMASSMNRRKVTFSDEDIDVYHSVVSGLKGSENIPDLLRTFKVLDMTYATLNNIEQVVNSTLRAGNITTGDSKFVQIYTNLMGFRIVSREGTDLEVLQNAVNYCFASEASRSGYTHYLGPTLDPLYSDCIKGGKEMYSYVHNYLTAGGVGLVHAPTAFRDFDVTTILSLPNRQKGIAIPASLLHLINQWRVHDHAGNAIQPQTPDAPTAGNGTDIAQFGEVAENYMYPQLSYDKFNPAVYADAVNDPMGGKGVVQVVAADVYVAALLRCLLMKYIPYDWFTDDTMLALLNIDPAKLKVTNNAGVVGDLSATDRARFEDIWKGGLLTTHDMLRQKGRSGRSFLAGAADMMTKLLPVANAQLSFTAAGVLVGGPMNVNVGSESFDPRELVQRVRYLAAADRFTVVFPNMLRDLRVGRDRLKAVLPFANAQNFDITEARSVEISIVLQYIQNILSTISGTAQTGLLSFDDAPENVVKHFSQKMGACPGGGAPQWWTKNPYRDADAVAVPANHPRAEYSTCNPHPSRLASEDIRAISNYVGIEGNEGRFTTGTSNLVADPRILRAIAEAGLQGGMMPAGQRKRRNKSTKKAPRKK